MSQPSATPYPVPIPTVSVFPGDTVVLVGPYNPPVHYGIDLVPASKRQGSDVAAGTPVAALQGGYVVIPAGVKDVYVKDNNSAYEIDYVHVEPNQALNGQTITANTIVGSIVHADQDAARMYSEIGQLLAHLHLQLRIPPGDVSKKPVDPTFLITNWSH